MCSSHITQALNGNSFVWFWSRCFRWISFNIETSFGNWLESDFINSTVEFFQEWDRISFGNWLEHLFNSTIIEFFQKWDRISFENWLEHLFNSTVIEFFQEWDRKFSKNIEHRLLRVYSWFKTIWNRHFFQRFPPNTGRLTSQSGAENVTPGVRRPLTVPIASSELSTSSSGCSP